VDGKELLATNLSVMIRIVEFMELVFNQMSVVVMLVGKEQLATCQFVILHVIMGIVMNLGCVFVMEDGLELFVTYQTVDHHVLMESVCIMNSWTKMNVIVMKDGLEVRAKLQTVHVRMEAHARVQIFVIVLKDGQELFVKSLYAIQDVFMERVMDQIPVIVI